MKIQKTDNIAEVLKKHPEIAGVLLDYNLQCVGCPASGLDTIEKGAVIHGLKEKDIQEMMVKINETIGQKE